MWQVWVEASGDAFAYDYCPTEAEAKAVADLLLSEGLDSGPSLPREKVDVVEVLFVG